MSSAEIFILNLALFVKILYEVCVANYAESYALGQHISLGCSGRSPPRKVVDSMYNPGTGNINSFHLEAVDLDHMTLNDPSFHLHSKV